MGDKPEDDLCNRPDSKSKQDFEAEEKQLYDVGAARKLWGHIGLQIAEPLPSEDERSRQLQLFIQECLVITGDNEDLINFSHLYLLYQLWCEKRWQKPFFKNEFEDALAYEEGRLYIGLDRVARSFVYNPQSRGSVVGAIIRDNWWNVVTID